MSCELVDKQQQLEEHVGPQWAEHSLDEQSSLREQLLVSCELEEHVGQWAEHSLEQSDSFNITEFLMKVPFKSSLHAFVSLAEESQARFDVGHGSGPLNTTTSGGTTTTGPGWGGLFQPKSEQDFLAQVHVKEMLQLRGSRCRSFYKPSTLDTLFIWERVKKNVTPPGTQLVDRVVSAGDPGGGRVV